MTALYISYKNLFLKPLTSALNILLLAFGTGIFTLLLLASNQINNKLESNSKEIDLVVGAKGSPLQLVLSSIYHIDFPTGNISLKDAEELMKNPDVKKAVPLALGDNFKGTRIVGTDHNFIDLYQLKLQSGKFWNEEFETTIGATVAETQQLKIGDTFFGAHGLSEQGDVHKAHAYKVSGILSPQGNVTDDLILTSIVSVWKMHDHVEHGNHEHGAELTSLLIQYRSPMSVVTFPRMVNETTSMQAASPAQESTRLFSLIGVGIETLQWFAMLIMSIAGISVFVTLYNTLKERSYDLAVMRTLGASRQKVFSIVIGEGLVLTIVGSVLGILLAHLCLELIGTLQQSSQARLTGMVFLPDELFIFLGGMLIGFISSLVPALQTYKVDISRVLSQG